jgi:hypothetical protein
MDWLFIIKLIVGIALIIIGIGIILISFGDDYKRKVTYTKFVNKVMCYTGELFHQNNIKYYPQVEIRYYKHNKWGGLHFPDGKFIIYTKSHQDVTQLVSITLHEIGHHFQMKTDPKEFNRYNEFSKKFGYKNNPSEV